MIDSYPLSIGAVTPSRRGPKSRLSRERLVSEAGALLSEISLEEFTLAKLAKRLGAGVMSIYTYFPSRDALLDAVAEDVFASFDASTIEGTTWQETILCRLWALQRLIQEYSIVTKVIFWDGHHSASWLKRWWLPNAQLLLDQGLDNSRAAFAMRWFSTAALGLIINQSGSAKRSQTSEVGKLESLTWREQRLAENLWSSLRDIEPRELSEFGFRNLVRGLENLLQNAATDGAAQEGREQ